MVKLQVTTFKVFLEKNGEAAVLAALKPIRTHNEVYIIDQARSHLNFNGNGPKEMLMVNMFAGSCIAKKTEGEVREKGSIGVLHDCIFKEGPPEFCMYLSRLSTQATAQIMNPDFESIWTHLESNGDPYCRFVFKKKTESMAVLEDMGRVIDIVPDLKIPPEQIIAMRMWAFGALWGEVLLAYNTLNGHSSVVDLIGPNSKNVGREIGEIILLKSQKDRFDSISLFNLCNSMSMMFNKKGTIMAISSEIFEKEIKDCPWQVFQTTEGCSQWHLFLQGMIEVLNPDYEFVCDRLMTRGDGSCHWAINRKILADSTLSGK